MTHFSPSLARFAFTLLLGAFVLAGLSACAEGNGDEGADSAMVDSAATTMPRQGGSQQDGVTAQSTISLLRGGVQDVAINQAVRNINGWQEQIGQQSGSSLSQIDSNLDQLKTELTATQLDGQALSDLLSRLGEQTTQAAANASGPQAQQLQQLGSLLSSASSNLAGNAGS